MLRTKDRKTCTVPEAAVELGVDKSTLYRHIKNKLIDHTRVGTAIRIPVDSLDKFKHKGVSYNSNSGKEIDMAKASNRSRRYIKQKFTIRVYKAQTGKWGVDHTLHGERERTIIGTEQEAKSEALRLETIHNSPGQRVQYLEQQKYQVSDLIKQYKGEELPNKKTKTQIKYTKILERFETSCGDIPLSDLTRDHIKRFLANLPQKVCSKTGKKVAFSNATWNDHRMIVLGFLNWAVDEELLESNPGARIRKRKVAKREPRFLNHKEINQLFKTVEKTRFNIFVAISIFAGTRLAETLALNWQDITFSSKGKIGMIAVTKSVNDGTTKNYKHRHVPLHKELENALLKSRQSSGPICQDTNGNRMSPENMQRDIKKIYQKMGIKGANIHCWRHTFAFLHLDAGTSLSKVGHWLGHADPKTTMLYAHWVRDDNAINDMTLLQQKK